MNRTYYTGAVIAAAMLLPAIGAFAQVAGSNFISVTSTPNTTAVSPGASGVILGSYTYTATQNGTVQVSALPFNLSASTGTASNLSNCQVVSGSTPLNTGVNMTNALQNGTNSITLDTPLTISSAAPVTLSLRCNVSTATPSGSSFTFSANAPILAPTLAVNLTTSPAIAPGELGAPVAIVSLSAARSGSNLNISSIPVTATFNGGVSPANLSNCHLQNAANLGASMNANSNGSIASGLNSFPLDSALTVFSGGTATLVLVCDVSTATPVGGSIQFAITPSSVTTVSASTGAVVTPAVGNGADGAAGSLSGMVTVVNANGSTTGIGTTVPPTTPGVPNTGAGGNAGMNYLILALSAMLALGGAAFIARAATVRS